jgi:hypothetical protein
VCLCLCMCVIYVRVCLVNCRHVCMSVFVSMYVCVCLCVLSTVDMHMTFTHIISQALLQLHSRHTNTPCVPTLS